jgi:hypothetical protein
MKHVKPPHLDIEPTILLAYTDHWERHRARERMYSYDLIKEARLARSQHQRELMRAFVRSIMTRVHFWRSSKVNPQVAPAQVRPA